MSIEHDQAGAIPPPAPPYVGAGYAVPTHSPEGVPLTPQQQISEYSKIPEFRDKWESSPHSMERRIIDDLNRKAAGLDPLAPAVNQVPPPSPNPAEYRIDWGPGVADLPPEQQQDDNLARAWLSTAGFDAESGSNLAAYVKERAVQLHSATPEELAAAPQRAWDAVVQMYGEEAAEGRIHSAKQLVHLMEAENPGVIPFLDATGLANDPLLILRLIQAAEAKGL